jgi:hypothetical protein
MRPDDVLRGPGDDIDGLTMPIDADLRALDAELDTAGIQARQMLYGRSQPTRYFSVDLRSRLVGGYAAGVAAPAALDVLVPSGQARGPRLRPELVPGETWAPTPLAPRIARRPPAPVPRARWAIFAAAGLTIAVVAGALGAGLGWLRSTPPTESSSPATSSAPVVILPDGSAAPGPIASPDASEAPSATTKPDPTPKPTRTPKPTQKPDPTQPPVLSMSLAAKPCPGGVVLDWTKPSAAVGHYHVLRSLGGEVPATYPAPGTTEIDSATSWSAGVTDGFDADVSGGQQATYRAFAFDATDEVVAFSPMKTVTTSAALSLGTLGYTDNGDGASITVAWTNPGVPEACFTYGKLVLSTEDPNPSYLEGSRHIAVVGDPSATGAWVEVPADLHGQHVWMRYQMIRSTSLGKFVVGSTDVAYVLLP